MNRRENFLAYAEEIKALGYRVFINNNRMWNYGYVVNDNDEKGKYEDLVEMYAEHVAAAAVRDMSKYVHQKSTRMEGNFCNIRQDWNATSDFIGSEVKPWGLFDDIVNGMDNNTLTDEEVAKVQTWCMDWFFWAFGTGGLKYNFQSFISELEYEEERCAV